MRPTVAIVRCAAVAVLATAASCSEEKGPAEAQVAPAIRAEIEKAARQVVAFNVDWGDRVEFRIYKTGDLWRVTAWRVVYPEAVGNKRYVPWGSRTIVIDRNYRVLEYRTGAK